MKIKDHNINKDHATELEYLKWFRVNADFGDGEGDVIYELDKRFEKETKKLVPENWRSE